MRVLDRVREAETSAEAIHALETAHTYDYVGVDGKVARYRNPSNGVTVTYDPERDAFAIERERLPVRVARCIADRVVPERVRNRFGEDAVEEELLRTYRFAADADTEEALRQVLERSDYYDSHLGPDRYWRDATEVRIEEDGVLVQTRGSYRDVPGGYLLDNARMVELEVGDGDAWITADADGFATLDQSR